jgi:hypothetical protein
MGTATQMSLRYHPGEHFHATASLLVGGRQIRCEQMRFKPRAKVVTLTDGILLGLLEGAANDEPHAAVVVDERVDSARRKR